MKTTITATAARANLYRMIEQASESHQPVTITGKTHNAVLIGEDDWNAIQETLYLVSIPGMRDSIVHGMAEPVTECETELPW
jgi:antitoxin YefM